MLSQLVRYTNKNQVLPHHISLSKEKVLTFFIQLQDSSYAHLSRASRNCVKSEDVIILFILSKPVQKALNRIQVNNLKEVRIWSAELPFHAFV